MQEYQAKTIKKRDDSLYMRIWKGDHSVQGMGIWQDRAFVLHDTGICAVHDLNARQEEPVSVFKLGSWDDGSLDHNCKNHANSCMFSDIHHNGNPIPLLYVTIGTGTGRDKNGYYYRCSVENIRLITDDRGKESYVSESLQTISYVPDGIEETPFCQPCWGCPAFLMDPEENFLYLFSARYRTKRECVPEGVKNTYLITKFALPDRSRKGLILLTPRDILDQFAVDSDVMFTQGGTIKDGKLYYTFGCPQAGYPLHILVFDLKKRCLHAHLTDPDGALEQEELECCAFHKGRLLVNTNSKSHGSIFVVPEAGI